MNYYETPEYLRLQAAQLRRYAARVRETGIATDGRLGGEERAIIYDCSAANFDRRGEDAAAKRGDI